jgi:hypothetical protein
LTIVPLPGALVFQRIATLVRDSFHLEEERVVHALRRDILNRNFADETVPGADEIDPNTLGNVDDTIRCNDDVGVEAVDLHLPRTCRGNTNDE